MKNKLRVGLLNIMPEAEKYEPSVTGLLSGQAVPVETVLIRAERHAYRSSDKSHLDRHYVTFDRAVAAGPLDGLIVTGAPMGAREFSDITYWDELTGIFSYAAKNVDSTIGLCWGGIALAKYLGLGKVMLPAKLFGVYSARWLDKQHWSADPAADAFLCPQSRYSSVSEEDIQRVAAAGGIRLLAGSRETGTIIFESADGRLTAHLGHPEYGPDRIMFEYLRDKRRGLALEPANFDTAAPGDNWRQASLGFFGRWLAMLAAKKQA